MKKLILLLACSALFTACNRDTSTGVGGDSDTGTGTTTSPATGSGAGSSSGTMGDSGTPSLSTNTMGTNQFGVMTNDANTDVNTLPPAPPPAPAPDVNPPADTGTDQP